MWASSDYLRDSDDFIFDIPATNDEEVEQDIENAGEVASNQMIQPAPFANMQKTQPQSMGQTIFSRLPNTQLSWRNNS